MTWALLLAVRAVAAIAEDEMVRVWVSAVVAERVLFAFSPPALQELLLGFAFRAFPLFPGERPSDVLSRWPIVEGVVVPVLGVRILRLPFFPDPVAVLPAKLLKLLP